MSPLFFWILLEIIKLLSKNADGACTLPADLRGTWISSWFGDTDFTDTIMYLSEYNVVTETIDASNPTNLTCEFSSGNYYVLKTTNNYTSMSVGSFYWYICLELTSLSSYSYYFYYTHKNDATRNPFTAYTEVCTLNQDTELFHVFVKKGFESEALTYCAKPFLGVFTYEHTSSSSSSSTCGLNWGDALLDVCNNNRTHLIFDLSLCSTKVAFSDGGHLGCVAALNEGTTYYQSVINFDSTLSVSPRAYRFTCFVIEYDGQNVTATEKGGDCVSGQTATTMPSAPGSLLYLVANTTCYIETSSPMDSSDNTVAIVAGVVVSLVLIGVVIGAVFGYKYYKRKKSDEKLFVKTKIDHLVSGGMADSLTKMPEPLIHQINGNPPKITNDSTTKESREQNPKSGVSMADTLLDVETDINNENLGDEGKEETETNNRENVSKEAEITPEQKRDDKKFDGKPKQSSMSKNNIKNDVIIEEVNEEVLTENTRPGKKVTFPDQVSPPGGLEKREHTILPSDKTSSVSSETKAKSEAPNPIQSEVLTNFGKEKTGMNSRKPSSNGAVSVGGDKANDEMFGKNLVMGAEYGEQSYSLGPRDHTLTDIII